jgi:hypothetical protein
MLCLWVFFFFFFLLYRSSANGYFGKWRIISRRQKRPQPYHQGKSWGITEIYYIKFCENLGLELAFHDYNFRLVEWLGLFFLKKINVGIRVSLRVPRLIPRALKLKLPVTNWLGLIFYLIDWWVNFHSFFAKNRFQKYKKYNRWARA